MSADCTQQLGAANAVHLRCGIDPCILRRVISQGLCPQLVSQELCEQLSQVRAIRFQWPYVYATSATQLSLHMS